MDNSPFEIHSLDHPASNPCNFEGLAQVKVLQKADGHLVPLFDDSRQKVRGLETKLGLEL